MNKLFIIVFSISNIFASLNLLAWNTGHDDVQKLVNDNLPRNIREKFSAEQLEKMRTHYSHYPDSFEKFDSGEVGDYAVELLKKLKVKNRYYLHHPEGIAASFTLLVESLRRKDYDRSAIWLASLGHTLADETALNHDPLIHYLTYHLWTYKLKTGKEIDLKKFTLWLDLTKPASDEKGKEIFANALSGHKPSIISQEPEDAIMEMLLKSSVSYPAYKSRISSTLVKYIKEGIIKKNPESKIKYIEIMRDLAQLSAKDIVNAAVTANYFAEKESFAHPDYEKLLKNFKEKLAESYQKKELQGELYRQFMKAPAKSSAKGEVGIIVEPFYSFNRGLLSPLWRYLAPALAQACEKRNIDYCALDLRNIYENGFPSPNDVPICILDTGYFNDFMWMKRNVFEKKAKEYCDKGGKLIWIGGNVSSIPGMTDFMERSKLKRSNYSGVSKEEIADASLEIAGDFSEKLKGRYSFVNSPETRAGWCKPYCNHKIVKCDELYMQLDSNGNKIPVSGRFGNIIFMPEYAISPYLINNEYNIDSLEKPSFDKFSEEIIIQAIEKLKGSPLCHQQNK
jgi:hypothetical protein